MDNENDFETDSGGGQNQISLAIRMALSLLVSENFNSSIEFLFLDEVLGPLDEHNTKQTLNLITSGILEEIGFNQVFLITHKDISDFMDNVILIDKNNGYSTAGWLQ